MTTFLLTDRNNKDRENPVIDTFTTREAAEAYRVECENGPLGYGPLQIEEAEEEDFSKGIDFDAMIKKIKTLA